MSDSESNISNSTGSKNQIILERRLELLKMEGIGLSSSDIVKQLSQKYQISPRNIYYDFEHRTQWQPLILQLKDRDAILQKIVNRYEQIYQRAAFKHVTSQIEAVQIGALKIMLDATSRLMEILVLPDLMSDVEAIKVKVGLKT